MGWILSDFTFKHRSIVRDVFVETGTFKGASLMRAALIGFKSLHSIELFRPSYENALEQFKLFPQVRLHFGSSPTVLPYVLSLIPSSQTVTFWLDAHYQARIPEEKDPNVGECPILAELDIIRRHTWLVKPVILIDDAHMFRYEEIPKGFDKTQWPDVKQITEKFGAMGLVLHEHNDILYGVVPEW